jgi:hypothetical protein
MMMMVGDHYDDNDDNNSNDDDDYSIKYGRTFNSFHTPNNLTRMLPE